MSLTERLKRNQSAAHGDEKKYVNDDDDDKGEWKTIIYGMKKSKWHANDEQSLPIVDCQSNDNKGMTWRKDNWIAQPTVVQHARKPGPGGFDMAAAAAAAAVWRRGINRWFKGHEQIAKNRNDDVARAQSSLELGYKGSTSTTDDTVNPLFYYFLTDITAVKKKNSKKKKKN